MLDGGGFWDMILAGVLSLCAWLFSGELYEDYKRRKRAGETGVKLETTEYFWVATGSLFVAFFLSIPVLLILKWTFGSAFVREYWHIVGGLCWSSHFYVYLNIRMMNEKRDRSHD
ncbi:MAG: hypothetical protein ACJAR0_002784 [Candidatus Azotimanducaceae bacterium]|jgi:hypothetical protein